MYGITKYDLKQIQKKHNIQRDYLKESYFTTNSGQTKTLLDVSFSANHSVRYYSEIINKINTINSIIMTESVDYVPIFITITLDGFFRDFLKGNFTRYNDFKHRDFIPNNQVYGFLRDKILLKEKFTIKDLYNTLNYQLKRFQSSSVYRKIKKDGFKPHYIRVCEPHKSDGVPHLHMMLYIPEMYKIPLLTTFIKYFPAPQNLKPLNGCIDGQLNGYQWNIKSAPAYILKYLFKSFLDVEKNNELDELQSWYIKHRILRVVTSHSLVPAWVYRKIIPLESDWFQITDIKKTGVCEWSKDDDYFMFIDENERVFEYDKGLYTYSFKNIILKRFGTKKDDAVVNKVKIEFKKYKKKEKNQDKKINYVTLDGVNTFQFSNLFNKFVPIVKVPSRLKDFELISYYNKLESIPVNDDNIQHFLLVKNEMIDRKFILSDKQSLNLDIF